MKAHPNLINCKNVAKSPKKLASKTPLTRERELKLIKMITFPTTYPFMTIKDCFSILAEVIETNEDGVWLCVFYSLNTKRAGVINKISGMQIDTKRPIKRVTKRLFGVRLRPGHPPIEFKSKC